MNSIQNWLAIMLVALSSSLFSVSLSAAQTSSQEKALNDAELAQILAPIALYPDSLLTHILIASTYPLEVVQASRWRAQHQKLEASQAVNLAEQQDWDPSVIALVAFPAVLEKLSDDLDWTQKLGDAFLQDEQQVLASIQLLRHQAEEANSFNAMNNMKITKVKQQIIIEPVQPQIIYVPVYDTRVVYGPWRWHNYPPIYWAYPPRYAAHYPSHVSGHFYWQSGIHISFNYFFSAFRWYDRHIVVTHHRHSHHYRPRARIVSNSGAQRWTHKPHHRRGVAYGSTQVKQRYNSLRPSTLQAKQLRNVERRGNNVQSKHYSTAQVKQSRELRFSQKLAKAERSKANTPQQFTTQNKHDSNYRSDNSQYKSDKQRSKQSRQQQELRDKNQQRDKSLQQVKSHQRDRSLQQEKSHQQVKSFQREKVYQRQVKSPQRTQSAQARPSQPSQHSRPKQRDK